MGFGLLLIILATVPVFYIYGIIQFLMSLSGKKRITDASYLETVIADLTRVVEANPHKTVKAQLAEYKKQLGSDAVFEEEQAVPDSESSIHLFNTPLLPETQQKNDVISNWYADNSINLLLYVGAFLIVLSASIFVGFQWGAIPGIIKAGLLTLLTLGFFGCGMQFYTIPKIKNAGYTFIAIGALLVPVCGAAWYTFVLKEQGITSGTVWLVTSVISLVLYLFLSSKYKSLFYMYIATASTLSVSLSLVNTFQLNSRFYILASITTSFILLLSSVMVKPEDKEATKLIKIPLEISSHILMPIALVYGLLTGIGQNLLFSLEGMLSIFLGAAFYFVSYRLSRQVWKLVIAELLVPCGILVYASWQQVGNMAALDAVTICGFLYLYCAWFCKQRKKFQEEEDSLLVIGFILVVLVYLYAWVTKTPGETAIFSFLVMVAGGVIAVIKNKISYAMIVLIFLGLSVYHVYESLPQFFLHLEYLTIPFVVLGFISYAIAIFRKNNREYAQTFGFGTCLYLCVALMFSFSSIAMLLIASGSISVIGGMSAVLFEEPQYIYLSNMFIYVFLIQVLRFYSVSFFSYPLYLAGLAYCLYGGSSGVRAITGRNQLSVCYRNSGLVAAAITPVIFGMISVGMHSDMVMEQYALVTAYGATILFGLDMTYRKTPGFGYVTSAMAVLTYLWQVWFWGVTETLWYTVPVGMYFIILSYVQRLHGNREGMHTLTLIGCLFLLVPPFFLSFGANAVLYSLVLGGFGICLIALGITWNDVYYRYAGVAGVVLAVLPQTWDFVLSLPRWVLVGGAGALFIGTALYLMLRKKE